MLTKNLFSGPFRIALLSCFMGVFIFSSCKKDDDVTPTPPNTITDIVSKNNDFTILKAAVIKADLATTLSGPGPFTVFAPNDAAFTASGINASAISQLPADALKNILLYHTIPSKIMAADVPAGPNAPVVTANGETVYVTKNGNGVFINGTKVATADVAADNGVIHIINGVLFPPTGNIVEVAQSDTTFSYLVAAVLRASQGATNVADILSGAGPFTVFAPTNNAFRGAGFATIDDINAAPPAVLTGILTYHVIGARIFSSDLVEGAMPATVNGGTVKIGLNPSASVKGNSNTSASNIIVANIMATNGVINAVDQVLLP
ncbi:MAG: fasciclin domain-containing protein [Ginsengibacter sp.]